MVCEDDTGRYASKKLDSSITNCLDNGESYCITHTMIHLGGKIVIYDKHIKVRWINDNKRLGISRRSSVSRPRTAAEIIFAKKQLRNSRRSRRKEVQ